MLLTFHVTNFASIRDRQEFSMYRPLKSTTEKSRWRRRDVSTVAAIYGSNAAGKSTFVQAMQFMSHAVGDSYRVWNVDGGTPRLPFLLDQQSRSMPSEFDVEFVAGDGIEYKYGFSLDDDRVVSEYLYMFKTNRRTTLFERDDSLPTGWYTGPSFRGPAALIRDLTRSNALFISAASAAGNDTLRPAIDWLTKKLRFYNAASYMAEHRHVVRRINDDETFKARIMSFLKHADLGIEQLSVAREEMDEESLARLESAYKDVALEPNPAVKFEDIVRERETTLRLSHAGIDGQTELPFDFESDGTHALISFASVAVRALDFGSVCVVDEIDASLHPLLVAELVSVFADERVNPHQAQLIFTTHDVSLIDRSTGTGAVLERDQVWVVEKDQTGASSITAVSEYRTPRKEENLGRGYLTGRFGGLPTVSIVNQLIALEEAHMGVSETVRE